LSNVLFTYEYENFNQLCCVESDLGHFSHQYQVHSPGSTGRILSEVECLTTERKLIECNYDSRNNGCTHAMDAGVQCMDGGKNIDPSEC